MKFLICSFQPNSSCWWLRYLMWSWNTSCGWQVVVHLPWLTALLLMPWYHNEPRHKQQRWLEFAGNIPFFSEWLLGAKSTHVISISWHFNPQRAGPSYLSLNRSISWLLMPWLLTSPGHQQPWYWLCRICRSWSYLGKDFKYLCHINAE